MSSEKTTNLQMHRWIPGDYMQRAEWNENFEKIDTKVGEHTAQLAQNANKLKGKVNIESFPLIVPEVDDTARIQRAVDSCGNNGRLYFGSEAGNFTYTISNTINIPYNDFSLFSDTKSEYGIEIKCTTPNIIMFNVTGYGLRVDNIVFTGDALFDPVAKTYTKGTVKAFNFDRGTDANIDAEITHCGFFKLSEGARVKGRNSFWHYNIFSICQFGVVIDGVAGQETRGHRFTNNRFHSIGGGDIGTVGDDSWCILINDVAAFGNDVIDNMVDFSKGFYKGPLSRSRIDNNNSYFQFGYKAIWITATQADTFAASLRNNLISGNKNYGDDPNAIETLEYGIYIEGACRYADIADNTITHTRKDGIIFKEFCTGLNVVNNKVINSNFRSDVDGSLYNGITFDVDVNDSLILDNHIRSTSVNGAINHKYGISFGGNASGCDIENFIVNALTASYKYPSSTSSSLTSLRDRKQYGGYEFYYPKNDASKQSISFPRLNVNSSKVDMAKMSVVPASLGAGVEKADLQMEVMVNGIMKNVFTAFYDGNAGTPSSAWNNSHLRMGNYHLWIDVNGVLRVKNGAPTSDIDGTIVGSQV